MKKKLIVFIISAMMLNIGFINIKSPVLAYAEEKSLEEASGELERVLNEISNMEIESQKTQEEINNLYDVIEDLESSASKLGIENEAIKEEIKEIEFEKEEKYEMIRDIIKIDHEQQSGGYLALLLEAKDFSNFIRRLEVVNNLIKNNNSVIEEIKEIERQLDEKKTLLNSQMVEVESKKSQVEEEMSKLQELVNERDAEIANLLEVRNVVEDEIAMIEQRIDEETALYAVSSDNYSGGEFSWPVASFFSISSPFGYRTDPISGESKFHKGIDIPAPGGTSVVAANSGVVIRSEYSGAYGNLVVIDHGGGVLTYYGHNNSNFVSVGQAVSKGQTIAAVGTTGYSTGNHLHFEVVINNEPVNPMDYVN